MNTVKARVLTEDNYADVADWCDGKVVLAAAGPRVYLSTGFSEDPAFKVSIGVGDRIERTEDGKYQVWIKLDKEVIDTIPVVSVDDSEAARS